MFSKWKIGPVTSARDCIQLIIVRVVSKRLRMREGMFMCRLVITTNNKPINI